MRLKTHVSRPPLVIGILLGVLIGFGPGFCLAQDSSVSSDGGVVVRKNADGSIDTFDSSDPGAPGSGGSAGSSTGSGKLIYGVHGQGKPYTRKHNDGVVVRRNADGSIETFDTTSTPVPLYGSSKPKKRYRKKSRRRYKSTKKSVKKKTTSKKTKSSK